MHHHVARVTCLTLVLFAASCRSHQAPPPRERTAPVTHVVLFWLKTPGDEAARQRIIDASRTFKDIPGVVSVSAGRALPSTRPVVDSSFDVALTVTFTDEESMRAYEGHPIHVKAVQEVLRPVMAKVVVHDFHDAGVTTKAPAR